MILLSLPPVALLEFQDYTCATPFHFVFSRAERGLSGLSDKGFYSLSSLPSPHIALFHHLFVFCISLCFRKHLLSASLIYHSMLRQCCNVYPETQESYSRKCRFIPLFFSCCALYIHRYNASQHHASYLSTNGSFRMCFEGAGGEMASCCW